MGAVEVWEHNLLEQMETIAVLCRSFPIVAIDTEFSGFLRITPRRAPEEERYGDLKYNVDNLRVIQLGITLFDASGNRPLPQPTWQINFSDFDPEVDPCSPEAIRLLENSGIDMQRHRREGVSSIRCGALLREKLFGGCSCSFVTFHGAYDVGYLMKMLTGGRPLPETLPEFITTARDFFGGRLYDVKFMARFCHGLLGGQLGLMKLADLLKVEADGVAHQAGFDSLVTGLTFYEMHKRWAVQDQRDSMILYGFESTCHKIKHASSPFSPRRFIIPLPMMRHPCAFPSQCFVGGGYDGLPFLPPATPHIRWVRPVPVYGCFPNIVASL
ncbi:putative CCR4-associated factor 1 homolog 11 [Curcuma longa]|uniref:putative CCR4-associated factor 1 homolog 11 n=1 Tax=Curcuma longa TaxID=136217 RepID=UPI003D9E39C9